MTYKYLCTTAIEHDGHAGSETWYLEKDREYTPEELLMEMFSEENAEDELAIKHKQGNRLYGYLYDSHFSFVAVPLEEPTTKLYTRTG